MAKVMIICSKHFYDRINKIKEELEGMGHEVMLPNSFDEPFCEERMKTISVEEHFKWKREMMLLHEPKIKENDAVLVLNFEKKGIPNYIGGATFMEIVKAWELEKDIYFYRDFPNCSFTDELKGMNPFLINGDLRRINDTVN